MSEKANDSPMAMAARVARKVQLNRVYQSRGYFEVPTPGSGLPKDPELSLDHSAMVSIVSPKDSALTASADFTLTIRSRDTEDPSTLLIKAEFVASYETDSSASEWTKKELQNFADLNVVYNLWPYWREFTQASFVRMALPPFVLPVFRVEDVLRKKSSTEKAAAQDS